jgi:TolB-like protein
MIGTTLSHFRILERLGEGAMGEVFLAEDFRLERPVALKILRKGGEDTALLRTRLLAEARAASALAHPNVAVVYEVDEAESAGEPVSFLALEYVAGEPLDRWAERKRPALDLLLDVALQVTDALAAAHARGFVHRDVKPSNLLVTDAGRVKVVDFGVAAALSQRLADLSTWTRPPTGGGAAGEIAGTLLYMAPEQALGRPLDGRADLYSLGTVLYELLAGAHPFREPTWAATLDAVLHRVPPPLDGAGEPRRAALARLVAAMIEKEPDARPASAAAVVEALAAIRAGSGAAPDEDAAPRAGALALLPFANLTGRAEDDWLGEGLREAIAAELERGAGVAIVARERLAEAGRRLGGGAGVDEAERARRLARRVGARWAVTGAVQRAGETVRVTGKLIDAESGVLAAAFKEDGPLAELFALQDRLAGALARRLVTGAAPAALPGASDETRLVSAYEALSKALLSLRTETYEGLDRALLLLERAVALDPSYVRAWIELGAARATRADYLGDPELLRGALEALDRALALAPAHPRALRERGAALVSAGRTDEEIGAGIAEIERALALAPDDAAIVGGMARALFLGRADFARAAEFFQRAAELAPLAGWTWLQLAHCRTLERRLDLARAAALRAIDLQERFLSGREGVQIVGGHMRLGQIEALEGRPEDAVAAFHQELAYLARLDHALRGRIQVELNLRMGMAQRALGAEERARAHFEAALALFERRLAMGADDPATRYYAGAAYAQQGERARALAELAAALAGRKRLNSARARREPEWAPLAGDPEFRALVGL